MQVYRRHPHDRPPLKVLRPKNSCLAVNDAFEKEWRVPRNGDDARKNVEKHRGFIFIYLFHIHAKTADASYTYVHPIHPIKKETSNKQKNL